MFLGAKPCVSTGSNMVGCSFFERKNQTKRPDEAPEVFVQQTMKTASSDEDLAFKQREKDIGMCHGNRLGERWLYGEKTMKMWAKW